MACGIIGSPTGEVHYAIEIHLVCGPCAVVMMTYGLELVIYPTPKP